eukprot:3429159-Pleurochrysis_carterae.AAC.2
MYCLEDPSSTGRGHGDRKVGINVDARDPARIDFATVHSILEISALFAMLILVGSLNQIARTPANKAWLLVSS